MPRLLPSALALFCLLGALSPNLLAQATPDYTVPVKANVLKGVHGPCSSDPGICPATVRDIINEANRILKKEGVKAHLHYDPSGPDDTKYYKKNVCIGNQDSTITPDEGRATDTQGRSELSMCFAGTGGKGWKLYFCDSITTAGFQSLGASGHAPAEKSDPPLVPVTLLSTRDSDQEGGTPGAATVIELGNSVAHEFSHVCTNGPDHLIAPGLPRADKGGHTPKGDPEPVPMPGCYLMTIPRELRMQADKNNLTDTQTDEINRNLHKIGFTAKQASGPVPGQNSVLTDALSDVTRAYIDIASTTITVPERPNGTLDVTVPIAVSLTGLLPDSGSLTLRYDVGFNTDNNTSTGQSSGAIQGIDKVLRLNLTGHYPFTGTAGSTTAFIIDIASSSQTSLTPDGVERHSICAETEAITDSVFSNDVLFQQLVLSQLSPTATTVPYAIVARELVSGSAVETDVAALGQLQLAPSNGAIITVSTASAGWDDFITISGTGFRPNASLRVDLDSDLWITTAADGAGDLSGLAQVPHVPSGKYHVVVSDSLGDVDFKMLTIWAPIPSGNVNGGSGSPLLGSVVDVLYVNGQSGSPETRTLELGRNAPVRISLRNSPSYRALDKRARFAIGVWTQERNVSTLEILPYGTGAIDMPILRSTGRHPAPVWIANMMNDDRYGADSWPTLVAGPAPVRLLDVPAWPLGPGTYFIQGVIEDSLAPNNDLAVTNGIRLVIGE